MKVTWRRARAVLITLALVLGITLAMPASADAASKCSGTIVGKEGVWRNSGARVGTTYVCETKSGYNAVFIFVKKIRNGKKYYKTVFKLKNTKTGKSDKDSGYFKSKAGKVKVKADSSTDTYCDNISTSGYVRMGKEKVRIGDAVYCN